MYNMIMTVVSNPIELLSQGQYLGILFWSIVFGIALKMVASDTTKDVITDCADAVTAVVRGSFNALQSVLWVWYSNQFQKAG